MRHRSAHSRIQKKSQDGLQLSKLSEYHHISIASWPAQYPFPQFLRAAIDKGTESCMVIIPYYLLSVAAVTRRWLRLWLWPGQGTSLQTQCGESISIGSRCQNYPVPTCPVRSGSTSEGPRQTRPVWRSRQSACISVTRISQQSLYFYILLKYLHSAPAQIPPLFHSQTKISPSHPTPYNPPCNTFGDGSAVMTCNGNVHTY